MSRREKFSFEADIDLSRVPISYIENISLTPNNIFNIHNESTSIPGISWTQPTSPIQIINASTFESPVTPIEVTDVFATEDGTYKDSTSVPLFNAAVLPTSFDSKISSFTVTEVTVLDKDFKKIDIKDYYLDTTNNLFYNNLENSINKNTLDYNVYYLDVSGIEDTTYIKRYTVLLNNYKVYDLEVNRVSRVALSVLGKIYTIANNSTNFLYTFPSSKTYAIRYPTKPVIQINPPIYKESDQQWQISFTPGGYYDSTYGLKRITPRYFEYDVSYEKASILSKNLISINNYGMLTPNHIILAPNMVWFDILLLVYDKDGKGIYASTQNEWLVQAGDLSPNGVKWRRFLGGPDHLSYQDENVDFNWISGLDGISSIDEKNGVIALTGFELKPEYQVYVSYRYIENYCSLESAGLSNLELNPQLNPSILTTLSSTGGFKLNTSTIELTTTSATGIRRIGSIDYINKSPENDYDIRLRAEKLIEERVDSELAKNIEISNYTDIGFFDGTPYSANGSFLVELPITIHEDFGGNLSTTEIQKIVENHIALGTYPLIRYYYPEIYITDLQVSSSSISISWDSYDY